MNRDKLIKEKLKKVCDYGKTIQGKVFSVESDGRNKIALAVMFQMNFASFMTFTDKIKHKWTKEQEDIAINKLDFLIVLCESSDETWELFWKGEQPINPKKFLFNEEGTEQMKFMDLNDIKTITVPMMGIK